MRGSIYVFALYIFETVEAMNCNIRCNFSEYMVEDISGVQAWKRDAEIFLSDDYFCNFVESKKLAFDYFITNSNACNGFIDYWGIDNCRQILPLASKLYQKYAENVSSNDEIACRCRHLMKLLESLQDNEI